MRVEIITKPHDIESNNFIASSQKLRNKYMTFVAATASDENLHFVDLLGSFKEGVARSVFTILPCSSVKIVLHWSLIMT